MTAKPSSNRNVSISDYQCCRKLNSIKRQLEESGKRKRPPPDPIKLAGRRMEKRYYVYALVDPSDCLPFYIGKGTGQRAWQHWRDYRSNPEDYSLKGLKLSEMPPSGPTVIILADKLSSFQALAIEADMLQLLQGELTNIRNGNDVAWANRWAARRLASMPTLEQYLADVPWGKPEWYHAVIADHRLLATWGHQ